MPTGVYKHKSISPEIRKKIGDANRGRKPSQETRKKMSINNGRYFLGKKRPEFSQEWKNKISITKKKNAKYGKENHSWKGGYENKLWHNNNRRVKKLGNGGFHTRGEWDNLKAQYNWTCPRCSKKEPEIILSRDHIIPLSKGGSDNIENVQPLCRKCNSIKHDKIIKYNP